MKMLKDGIHGFCMALADSVPGVSGGTIAFIMGFYDHFIGSIHGLVFGNMQEKKSAVKYLAKLGVGWVIGMAAAVMILTSLFESHIYAVSSLFFGFVLGSVPFVVEEDLGQFSIGTAFRLFLIGMIAISAMFLPGISGSMLLLIFGAYIPVITAVKAVLSMNFSYIPNLMFFGFGVLTGAVTVVKAIRFCLGKYRPQTVYAILGMMIGSLYAICMGPTTLETPLSPLDIHTFHAVGVIVGIALVYGLQKWGK